MPDNARAGAGLLETILSSLERARDSLRIQTDLTERLLNRLNEVEERVVALEALDE